MTFVFGCFKEVHLLICCVQGVSKKWTARLKKKHVHHLSSNYVKHQNINKSMLFCTFNQENPFVS